ncbi:MAG: carboxy terminal-processing peptidase [Bacteroidota bacterium]
MKKIKYSFLLLPAMVLLTLAFCFRKNIIDESRLSQSVLGVLHGYHYEPQEIDNNFSKNLFKLYLKRLDNNKRFFLQVDVDSLKQYQVELDDQAQQGQYQFFDMTNRMYSKRVNMISGWYSEILASPFDFKKDEYFEFNEDQAEFLKSEKELKEFWRLSIKQQVLERLYDKIDLQEKAQLKKDTFVKIKSYDTLEKIARAEVLKMHNDWFQRLKKFDRSEKLNLYINCMTELFDPHTNYFPPKDKENFDIRMSGKLEGIGAQLQEKDGFLKVAGIVPGSPSYKQGELKAGDIILKVAQGNGDPVDVTNMKIDDAIQLIRGKKGTEVRLTVKKPDESIKVIPIIREVVVLEDGFAKSAIVVKDGLKYGYINLPTFYIDMNDRNGRSCAKDIAIEVEKLKQDNVSGIILDLRNNGGGSLGDVIDIAGMFIEEGPVTMVKSKGDKIEIYGDEDSRVLYSGPLTIMVNENSASASEILAAAMQDYHRAAIIGTTTYGKGTVQRFIELDNNLLKNVSAEDDLGSLKITIQKFYRVNGGTTQLAGVTPDILIPDRYRYIEFGEKDNEHPLGDDKIAKAMYSTQLNFADKIAKAKKNSEQRIAASKIFNEIEQLAVKIKEQSKRTRFTLNLEKYKVEQKQIELDNKAYEESVKAIQAMSYINTTEDDNLIGTDELKKKMKADWNKSFEKDIYIQEAIEVLKDL